MLRLISQQAQSEMCLGRFRAHRFHRYSRDTYPNLALNLRVVRGKKLWDKIKKRLGRGHSALHEAHCVSAQSRNRLYAALGAQVKAKDATFSPQFCTSYL